MAARNVSFYLVKVVRISGWALLLLALAYMASGYALCGQFGFDRWISLRRAAWLHANLDLPFIALLLIHVVPAGYLAVRRRTWARKRKQP